MISLLDVSSAAKCDVEKQGNLLVRVDDFGHTERICIHPLGKDSNMRLKPSVPPLARDFNCDLTTKMNWSSVPPVNPRGLVLDLSGRPIMCGASYFHQVVFGGSDHALYAIDLEQPKQRPRKMHSQRHGHVDWVTGVAYTCDGNIVSGGMDGRLCFWSPDQRHCRISSHHTRSISDVTCVGNLAFSGSYDCTVGIWNVIGIDRGEIYPHSILRGHKSPVIVVKSSSDTVVAGGKDGGLLVWDIATSEVLARVRGHKDAPCNSISISENSRYMVTAGGDGMVKLWDPRAKRLISEVEFVGISGCGHPTPLSCVELIGEHGVSVGGTDGANIFDFRRTSKTNCCLHPLWSFRDGVGGIHCMKSSDGTLFVGDGRGILLSYNILLGKLNYGLGASADGPVKSVHVIESIRKVVTAGEDGKAMIYSYNQ